jgi:hypothetical protein
MYKTTKEFEENLENLLTRSRGDNPDGTLIKMLWNEWIDQVKMGQAQFLLGKHRDRIEEAERIERHAPARDEIRQNDDSSERREREATSSAAASVSQELNEIRWALEWLKNKVVTGETAKERSDSLIDQANRWLAKAEAIHHDEEKRKPILRPPHIHEHSHGGNHDQPNSFQAARHTVEKGLSTLSHFKGDFDEVVHVVGLLVTNTIKLAKSGPAGLKKEFLDEALQLSQDATGWMRDQILPQNKVEAATAIGLDVPVIIFAGVAIKAGIHEALEMRHDKPIIDNRIQELASIVQSLEKLEKRSGSRFRMDEGNLPAAAETFLHLQRIGYQEELSDLRFSRSQNRSHGVVGGATFAAGIGVGLKVLADLTVKGRWLDKVDEGLIKFATGAGAASVIGISPFTAAGVAVLGVAAYYKIRQQRQNLEERKMNMDIHRQKLLGTDFMAETQVDPAIKAHLESVYQQIEKQTDFFKRYHRGMMAFVGGAGGYSAFTALVLGEVISSYQGKGEWLNNLSTIPVPTVGLIASAIPLFLGSISFYTGHPRQDQYQQEFQNEGRDRRFLTALNLLPMLYKNKNVDPLIALKTISRFSTQNDERERLRQNFVDTNKSLPEALTPVKTLDLMLAMHAPLKEWLEKKAEIKLFDYYGPLCEADGTTAFTEIPHSRSPESSSFDLNMVVSDVRNFAKVLVNCQRELEVDQLILTQAWSLERDLDAMKQQLMRAGEESVNNEKFSQVINRFTCLQLEKAYETDAPIVSVEDSLRRLAQCLLTDFERKYEERRATCRETELAGGMMLNRALETLSQEVTQSLSRQELQPLPPAEQFMIPERWWRSTTNNRESSSWDINLEEGLRGQNRGYGRQSTERASLTAVSAVNESQQLWAETPDAVKEVLKHKIMEQCGSELTDLTLHRARDDFPTAGCVLLHDSMQDGERKTYLFNPAMNRIMLVGDAQTKNSLPVPIAQSALTQLRSVNPQGGSVTISR